MNRTTRSLVSLVCLVTVVFTQLAVSASACPKQAEAISDVSAASTVAVSPVDGCDISDTVPALCQKHCEDGQQNVSTAPSPTPVMILNSFFINPSPTADVALFIPKPAAFLHHATSPPHAIHHCCFRI